MERKTIKNILLIILLLTFIISLHFNMNRIKVEAFTPKIKQLYRPIIRQLNKKYEQFDTLHFFTFSKVKFI